MRASPLCCRLGSGPLFSRAAGVGLGCRGRETLMDSKAMSLPAKNRKGSPQGTTLQIQNMGPQSLPVTGHEAGLTWPSGGRGGGGGGCAADRPTASTPCSPPATPGSAVGEKRGQSCLLPASKPLGPTALSTPGNVRETSRRLGPSPAPGEATLNGKFTQRKNSTSF